MFILKKTHDREIQKLNGKVELAREVHKIDQEMNRSIIKDLGRQLDVATKLSESRVLEIQELNREINEYKEDTTKTISTLMEWDKQKEDKIGKLETALKILDEEINEVVKSRQAWIEECLGKDQELEEVKNELNKFKNNYEILCKDNLILMKDNARIFELKRQMKDKLEAVMLCSMNKIPKSEVLSKLSKKDIYEIIELFALM